MIPRIIKTSAQHEAALARIEDLFDAKPGTARGDELELLLLLVEKYEDEHFPINLPDPITAIKFRMEQQNLKAKDLVPYIGSKSKVSEVLRGQRELSLTMIRNLVDGLGIPAEVLLRKPGASLVFSEFLDVGKDFPLAEMFHRGWFQGIVNSLRELKEKLQEVLAKFAAPLGNVNSILALNRQRLRHGRFADQPALVAWQIRVMSRALQEALPPFTLNNLNEAYLAEVARLSLFDNGPLLAREFLNKSGIHLVIEQHLPKTFLDGAAIRLPNDRRLVALTLRHDRLDHFWFTLLHELAHITLHLNQQDQVDAIFDDLDNEAGESQEEEADATAREALIPESEWKAAGLLDDYSEERVRVHARKWRISPAIVAGRIRHDLDNPRLLGDLVGKGLVRKQFEAPPPQKPRRPDRSGFR